MIQSNPFILFEETEEDGPFLCNPETNRVLKLNGVGALIWKQLERGVESQEAIVEALGKVFKSVQQEQLSRDVSMYLEVLEKHGLLR